MKSIKNRKLKGSVLLTVVSVMALLIIFLFGTLVLATAANNRAHINYSTAQTSITARTVVNTAYEAIGKNKDYADAVTALSDTNKTLDIPVTISSGGTNTNTLGKVDSLTAEYAGKRKYYNSKQKKWQDCDVIRLTANVTMNGITTSSSAYIVKDPPEPPGGGGGGGAGFVTTGGAGFPSQSNLYGGSYLGLPKKEVAQTYDYLTGYATYSGNYLSHEDFSFKNSLSLMEADVVINGNFDPGNLSKILYPGKGRGITIWGNCTFSDSSFGNIKEIRSPNLTVGNAGSIDFKDIPFFYVDGEFSGAVKTGPQSTTASEQYPFNTFAGNMNATGNSLSIGGDLYLMNPDKDNVMTVNDATLYSWTASVITKKGSSATSQVQGRIYSKGNLEIGAANGGGIKAKGVYGEKNIKVSKALDITGDIVCGQQLQIIDNKLTVSGNIYCDNVVDKDGTAITTYNGKTIKHKADYSGKIYPDYAERDVLLGKNTTLLKDSSNNDIAVEDSQVVTRMDQVLDKVINPYTSDELPAAMKTVYNNLKTDATHTYTTIDQTRTSPNTACKSWWDATNKKVKLEYDATTANGWPVIKESCWLKDLTFSNGDIKELEPSIGISSSKVRAVVFDPGATDMLVVFDNVTFQNPVNIIVNDSQGGHVYFYFEGGTSNTAKKTTTFENFLLTTKYMDIFMKVNQGVDLDPGIAGTQNSIQIFTSGSYAMPYDATHADNPVPFNDATLGLSVPATKKEYSPGCRMYAAKNSILMWNNFACCTANIVSPNVELHIESTNGTNDIVSNTKIYYNGDLVNNFPGNGKKWEDNDSKFKYMIGCCNSESTTFKNQINMLYVPDEVTGGTPITMPDSTHWYSMLYYDEY